MDEMRKGMTLMLLCFECKIMGTSCMYVYHVHQDTFSLCYVSTDAYLQYHVRHDIMWAFLFRGVDNV